MNEEVRYWKWKSTIIDFNAISDEPIDYADYPKKKEWVFRYLGIPDNDIHEWYNGGFSSEYNRALKYAKELGLVEDYIDYDNIIYDLKLQLEQRDNIINKAIKLQLEQRDNIINKAKEFVYDYKKQWTLNDDVVDDMNELLEILNIDKGE